MIYSNFICYIRKKQINSQMIGILGDRHLDLPSAEEVEKHFASKTENKFKKLRIPCCKCNKTYKINLPMDITNDVENYPFPLVLMHTAHENDRNKIHTLIAYIDKDLKCRHIEFLEGKRVFITPYIIYNPSLLQMYCNK